MHTYWQTQLGVTPVVWAPRLTAGIYAVARALGARRVVLPNNCCAQVVYGVLLAGAEPVFCEIDLTNGALDLPACELLLRGGGVDMVIHVHLFGLYSDRDAVHRLCRRQGVFLLESAGNWFPPGEGYGVPEESCLGISFGERKTFDFGGGSVIGFSSPALANDVQRILRELPHRPPAPSDYGVVYQALLGEEGMPKSNEVDLAPLAERYRGYWIGSCPVPPVDLTPERVTAERARRTSLAAAFTEALAPLGVDLFASHPLDFPWRLSFRFRQRRRLMSHVGAYGVGMTCLHPPLDAFFPGLPKSEVLVDSYTLGSQVCNLRLDPDIGREAVSCLQRAVRDWTTGRFAPYPPNSTRGRVRGWLGRLARRFRAIVQRS